MKRKKKSAVKYRLKSNWQALTIILSSVELVHADPLHCEDFVYFSQAMTNRVRNAQTLNCTLRGSMGVDRLWSLRATLRILSVRQQFSYVSFEYY